MPEKSYSWAEWKCRKDVESSTIGGICPTKDVPSYGEIGYQQIPDSLCVQRSENKTITVISPPVICSSFAYRYRIVLTAEEHLNVALLSDYALALIYNVERIEGPATLVNPTNWYWARNDDYWLPHHGPTPKRLMKKWKKEMMEIILEHHPEKTRLIDDWISRLEAYKAHKKSLQNRLPRQYQKRSGDIVLALEPRSFSDGSLKQFFVYETERNSIYKRAKGFLSIGSSRYNTAKTYLIPIKTFLEKDLDGPVITKLVANLIAWKTSPLSSNHQVLIAQSRYLKAYEKLILDLDTEENDKMTLKASIAAINDFIWSQQNTDGFSFCEANAHKTVNTLAIDLKKQIQIMLEPKS